MLFKKFGKNIGVFCSTYSYVVFAKLEPMEKFAPMEMLAPSQRWD
jgi:hypothetical protein